MDNNVTYLTGRLSQNPNFFGEGDSRRALFSVAVNRGFGEKTRTVFVDCIAWAKMADFMQQFKKGSGIHIVGEVDVSSVEKEGEKRNVQRIKVNMVTPTATLTKLQPEGKGVVIGGDDDTASVPF